MDEGSKIDDSGVSARTSVLLLRSARCTSSVNCDCRLVVAWGLETTGEWGCCVTSLVILRLVSVLDEETLLRSEYSSSEVADTRFDLFNSRKVPERRLLEGVGEYVAARCLKITDSSLLPVEDTLICEGGRRRSSVPLPLVPCE